MQKKRIECKLNLVSELFYKKCFSYCRLCVAKSYQKNYRALLSNDLYVYNRLILNDYCCPVLEIRAVEDEDNLLKNIGIDNAILQKTDIYLRCNNIIEELSRGNLCIQTLDNFFYPSYSFLYHKKHSLHGFIIYGFDFATRSFLVVEPWGFHVNRSLFDEIQFAMFVDIIQESANSILTQPPQTFVYRNSEAKEELNPQERFVWNYNQNISEIENGLLRLEKSLDEYFITAIEDNTHGENVLLSFRRLIEKKNSQWYQLKEIFSNEQIDALNLNVVEQFTRLRELYHRFKCHDGNNQVLLKETQKAIRLIIDSEWRLHELLHAT